MWVRSAPGKNVKQMVGRALQHATSDPKGPVYLMGAREVMEEEIQPYTLVADHWRPTEPSALLETAAALAEAFVKSKQPFVITGYSGRNHNSVAALVIANNFKGLRVLDTGGCDICFPADHPGCLGLKYGADTAITTADLILSLNVMFPESPRNVDPSKTFESSTWILTL